MSVLLSPCCVAHVRVERDGDAYAQQYASRYYVCSKCGVPCDPIESAPDCDEAELRRSLKEDQ